VVVEEAKKTEEPQTQAMSQAQKKKAKK